MRDVLRIAFYKDTFANNRGADKAVKALASGLNKRGHAVRLFDKDGLAAFLSEPNADVVIAAGTNEILDLAAYADRLPPIVLQFHTDPDYPFRHWVKHWRRNRAIQVAMRKCALIQILRPEYAASVLRRAPNARVTAVGNGFDFPAAARDRSENIVVYPAAVNKDKNQKLLEAAFESLKSEFPDWRLELYGKGTANGFCDLNDAFTRCAFLAFPSKTEGFPLTVVEAAAYAKPAVMIKDWIGTCAAGGGIVTEPSVKAYAAGLRRLMADAGLRRDMGEKARTYCAEHYAREKILDQWEELLKSVVRAAGGDTSE